MYHSGLPAGGTCPVPKARSADWYRANPRVHGAAIPTASRCRKNPIYHRFFDDEWDFLFSWFS
jgi:hypothetical protein